MAGDKKSNKGTVLIVEDEPALSDIYATKLVAEGYDVIAALDGVEGFNKAVNHLPSIILLDIVLPIKNGFDVLRDLKLNPKTADIPVIILSNLGQSYEIKRGFNLGAIAFLTKANLLPSQVVNEVNKALSGAHQE
ncbi:MAG: response regulator [Patescibacteria group bacterium]|nr:response regulator [Patescibacteria group bacterium]